MEPKKPGWLNQLVSENIVERQEEATELATLSNTIAHIRDIQTANFCNLIDELAHAKDVGGSNFIDAKDMLVRLLEFHTEIRTLDYVLAEIEYACGDTFGEAKS